MKTSKLQHHVHDDSCFAAIPKTRPTPGSLPSLPRIDPELVSLDLHPGYRKAEAAIAGHPAVPRGRSFPESRVRACPFPKTARCTRMRCPSAAQVTWELWTRVVMARGSASQISCWSLQWTSPEHCGESFHATVHLAAPCGQRTSCRPEGSHTMHSTCLRVVLPGIRKCLEPKCGFRLLERDQPLGARSYEYHFRGSLRTSTQT